MWRELATNLARFESAVLTGTDADGYPFSVRCKPQLDREQQVLRIELSDDVPIQPGAAGLLCHSHNESLWNLKSFLVRGRLEREAEEWVFRPAKLIPGMGFGGPVGELKSLLRMRRTAGKYLERRKLARPRIPWDEIRTLRAEANRPMEAENSDDVGKG
jgi:hypothetical protein